MPRPPQPEMMALILGSIDAHGYLDQRQIEDTASRLRLPSSRVYGFYTQFEELPRHPHRTVVCVCTGPACASRGSEDIFSVLRQRVPEGVEVISHPGLGCWHRSPTLCIQPAGVEKRLMEITTPEDVDRAVACITKDDYADTEPWSGALPPPAETLPGYDLPPWWEPEGKGEPPGSWGPDLVGWVGDHPVEALQQVADFGDRGPGVLAYMAAMEEAAGGGAPPILVCDTVGAMAENAVSCAASMLQARAVVAGTALAAAACGTEEVVFYVSWMDEQMHKTLQEAMDQVLPGSGVKGSIFRGPSHIPCSLYIGRAAVMRGSMLWQAASEFGWDGVRFDDRPLAVLPAEAAMQFPWIMGKSTKRVKKWAGGRLVGLAGHVERPHLVFIPPRTSIRDMLTSLEAATAGIDLKAVQALGMEYGPVHYDRADALGIGTSAQLLLLDNSTCMVRWALYLARRARGACCGGCAPGRTVPAVVERMIMAVLQGCEGEPEMEKLESVLATAGDLALCSRLGEMLGSVRSCLSNFKDEFSAHAVDGICKSDSCALPAKAGT